jgi:hypothetical protein
MLVNYWIVPNIIAQQIENTCPFDGLKNGEYLRTWTTDRVTTTRPSRYQNQVREMPHRHTREHSD